MAHQIKVVVNTPAGLQHEILTGAITQDDGMAVVEATTPGGTADVLIVAEMRDARRRDVLHDEGTVLAIDGYDQRVDMYELRPLGQATQAADLTGIIRELAHRPARGTIRARVAHWMQALLHTPTGRTP